MHRGARAVRVLGLFCRPFQLVRGNCAHLRGQDIPNLHVCLVLLLQCLLSCSLVCRPVGFKFLLQNSVPLFEQSYVSLMALCRGVRPVCLVDFVCM